MPTGRFWGFSFVSNRPKISFPEGKLQENGKQEILTPPPLDTVRRGVERETGRRSGKRVGGRPPFIRRILKSLGFLEAKRTAKFRSTCFPEAESKARTRYRLRFARFNTI